MGNVQEGFKGYVDVWKMNAFDEINFQQELREQYATVQAVESQKLLQQIARAGGLGGGGVGGGTMGDADLGNQAQFWRRWNNVLYTNSGSLVTVSILAGIIAWLAKNTFFLGFAVFVFIFASVGFVSQATLSGSKRKEVFTSKIIFSAAAIALIFAIVVVVAAAPALD